MVLFERYVTLLEKQFGRRFEMVSSLRHYSDFESLLIVSFTAKIIAQDELLPMYIEKESELNSVLDTVWLRNDERDTLIQ